MNKVFLGILFFSLFSACGDDSSRSSESAIDSCTIMALNQENIDQLNGILFQQENPELVTDSILYFHLGDSFANLNLMAGSELSPKEFIQFFQIIQIKHRSQKSLEISDFTYEGECK